MRLLTVGGVLLLGISLSACQLTTKRASIDTSSVQEMEQELDASIAQAEQQKASVVVPPQAVNDALLPPLTIESDFAGSTEEHFDISVEDLDAKDFFFGLVKDTDYNMVIHPGVKGKVDLELKNVTVDEVMQVMRKVYGYDYDQSHLMYYVLPTGKRTQIFKINYLNVQRAGSSETQVSAGQVSSVDSAQNSFANDLDSGNISDTSSNKSVIGTHIKTTTNSDFWGDLSNTLNLILSSYEGGGSVVVSPQAGVVVVSAEAKQLRAVQEFLEKAELSIRRQVIIEAKILEVTLNDSFQAGINWSAVAEVGSNKNIVFSQASATLSSANQIGGAFQAALNLNDFNGLIDLLGTQGVVQVLSSPRISTVNNQKAVIKVGTDEFFVTEVSSQTTSTTTSTTPSVDVELTPFFSGIALDVTPQISEENEIILHVHPTVSEVVDQTKTVDAPGGTLTLPLALSTIRESDSIIRAKNGQVVVIGGLMQNVANDENAKSPWISEIPVFGAAFKQKRQTALKSELVILLKPVIANDDTWNDAIKASRKKVKSLRQSIETGEAAK
jgi:MSHA biogenesis protein MshL